MLENMVIPSIQAEKNSDGDANHGTFVCGPLERGFGTTLGNALRRVLLSSLPGAAITSIKIDGVLHEFSTIPGVREDVTNIVLNLKQLCLKMHTDEPQLIRIDIEGEKKITAADIQATSDVEILNKDLHIATLNEEAKLHMEMTVERGRGYVPSEKNKKGDDPIGLIPIDSIFSPILRVNCVVSPTRVGNVTDYDKLTIDVWTDGSITPEEALSRSAEILIIHLGYFKELAKPEEDGLLKGISESDPVSDEPAQTPVLTMPIEDLDLSVRSYNCLKRAAINTVGDLIEKTEDDMMRVRNLGKKSLDEVKKKLDELGESLAKPEE